MLLYVSLYGYETVPLNGGTMAEIIKDKELKYTIDGKKLTEISDLAYDKNSSILYMVSDKGILFTFKAKFSGKDFTLKPLHSYYLKDRSGKRLKGNFNDSEGMTIKEGELYISFERITKIFHFSKKGVALNEVKLPKALENVELSSSNKSLEALAWSKKYGFITALEYPKRGTKRENQTIYSTSNKNWKLKMEKITRNGITAIEVMDDGNLLVLERAFNWFIGKFEVNLVKLFVNGCDDGEFCKKRVIMKLSISRFWNMENFEGLARVGKKEYIMVSDDNNNIFGKTVIVYFRIK